MTLRVSSAWLGQETEYMIEHEDKELTVSVYDRISVKRQLRLIILA